MACWWRRRSLTSIVGMINAPGGLIPLSFPFISWRFKVTNMFYSVVCRNSMRGDVDRLIKGTRGTGAGLSSLLPSVRGQDASPTFS